MSDDPKFDHIVLAEKQKAMVFLALFFFCLYLSVSQFLLIAGK